jgi:hypothetical protein
MTAFGYSIVILMMLLTASVRGGKAEQAETPAADHAPPQTETSTVRESTETTTGARAETPADETDDDRETPAPERDEDEQTASEDGGAAETAPVAGNWTRYAPEGAEFSIRYPADTFTTAGRSDDGAGVRFSGPGDASLEVYAERTDDERSTSTFERAYEDENSDIRVRTRTTANQGESTSRGNINGRGYIQRTKHADGVSYTFRMEYEGRDADGWGALFDQIYDSLETL